MKKVNVVYATKTQHSKKLAEAIAKEFSVTAKNVEKFPEPEESDLLYLVGGIYAGKSNPMLLSYAERLNTSFARKVILVTSSVSISHRSQRDLYALLRKRGIDVADEITCTGGLLFLKFTHPNKVDIQTIVKAAKDVSKG